MKNQAFTLIELLVVVLIIGILAAIALPKYEVAVEKSRMAEALLNAKAILQARAIEALQSPGSFAKAEDIMELSGGYWNENGNQYCTTHFRYVLEENNEIEIWRGTPNDTCSHQSPTHYAIKISYTDRSSVPSSKRCEYLEASSIGKKTCYAMAGEFDYVDSL